MHSAGGKNRANRIYGLMFVLMRLIGVALVNMVVRAVLSRMAVVVGSVRLPVVVGMLVFMAMGMAMDMILLVGVLSHPRMLMFVLMLVPMLMVMVMLVFMVAFHGRLLFSVISYCRRDCPDGMKIS